MDAWMDAWIRLALFFSNEIQERTIVACAAYKEVEEEKVDWRFTFCFALLHLFFGCAGVPHVTCTGQSIAIG